MATIPHNEAVEQYIKKDEISVRGIRCLCPIKFLELI